MFSLSCFFKTESVIPELNETRPNIIKPTETIRVGNLGTSPVFKYSVKTGINKTNDSIKKIAESTVKNKNGFVSLKSLLIVFNTLKPSL